MPPPSGGKCHNNYILKGHVGPGTYTLSTGSCCDVESTSITLIQRSDYVV